MHIEGIGVKDRGIGGVMSSSNFFVLSFFSLGGLLTVCLSLVAITPLPLFLKVLSPGKSDIQSLIF